MKIQSISVSAPVTLSGNVDACMYAFQKFDHSKKKKKKSNRTKQIKINKTPDQWKKANSFSIF